MMALDGRRRKGVALVSDEGCEWWQEWAILGFIGDSGVVVCTPFWDEHFEQGDDNESMRVLGHLAGELRVAILRAGRVVHFDPAVLQERWDALLGQDERGGPNMREPAVLLQGFIRMSGPSWCRSGLGPSMDDPGVGDPVLLSDLFEGGLWYDDLNIKELLGFKKLEGRCPTWEKFYEGSLRRNTDRTDQSSSVDAEERYLFLGESFSRTRSLVSPLLQVHVAEKLKAETAIKEERKRAQEERILQPKVEVPNPKRRGSDGPVAAEEG